MKRLFVVFVVLSLVFAAGCSQVPQDDRGVIHVSGQGKVTTQPDTMEIKIVVRTEGATKDVQQENAVKAEAVMSALLEQGLEEDDMETQSVNFYPLTRWDKETEQSVTEGYVAESTLSVETGQLDKAGLIADTAIKAGAERIYGMNFFLSEKGEDELLGEVIDDAVADARVQAEAAAAAAGTGLDGIKTLAVSRSSGFYPVPVYGAGEMLKADEAAVVTPVNPGEVDFTVSVSIEYFIK